MASSVGIYISVPFCKVKCTYCNFASGVFGPERMDQYVDRVCDEIAQVRNDAIKKNALLSHSVDSIFLGGGTPSLLSADQMSRLFGRMRENFAVAADAEVTLECAPGQLSDATLAKMLANGMNRISFGVQSFVDAEARAVGRLHTRSLCEAEIVRMGRAGIENINVDLIVGLPGQTAANWRESVEVAIQTGVPHISIYMLEVDEDSRLGREMLRTSATPGATGEAATDQLAARYGAASAPTEDETADWYSAACEWLSTAGIQQYEISNFARPGHSSRHNLKYWRRDPYFGFGLDAHSMLQTEEDTVRWANSSDLEQYLDSAGAEIKIEVIGQDQAFEEAMFLGLRMNAGVDLNRLRATFGTALVSQVVEALEDVEAADLVKIEGSNVKLTAAGRIASNEVFGRLLVATA